jgi:hypothetical protein
MFTRYREPIEVESTLQSIARQDSYRCCERAPNSDGERRLFDGRLLSPRSFNSRSIYLCYYRWYDYLHLENRILYHVGPRPKNEGGNASIQIVLFRLWTLAENNRLVHSRNKFNLIINHHRSVEINIIKSTSCLISYRYVIRGYSCAL